MTFSDIVDYIHSNGRLPKKDTILAVNSLVDILKVLLERDQEIIIRNFGKFKKIRTKPRNINFLPKNDNGSIPQSKPYSKVKFKASTGFLREVRRQRKIPKLSWDEENQKIIEEYEND